MQFDLFHTTRPKPFCGFPNPALVPKRARNYVQVQDKYFRRDTLSIGTAQEMWWGIYEHAIHFEISEADKARIPAFTLYTDMDSYVERLVAFERTQVPQHGALSHGEGTHAAGPGKRTDR
ncbi:MAG TPA: hypothetical protein PLB89_05095 [Flavobacteriales bacterium]|nr:hypothetical protein [Flavobacteriales bacterium]